MNIKSGYEACAIIEEFCEGEGSTDEQKIEAFQFLINNGSVWSLQGFYGRTAARLIAGGQCVPNQQAN